MHQLRLLSSALVIFACLAFTPNISAHQDPEQAGYIAVEGGKIWYRMNGMQFLGKKGGTYCASWRARRHAPR